MYLWCKSTYFFCEKGHFEMGFVEKFFPQKKCEKKSQGLVKKNQDFFLNETSRNFYEASRNFQGISETLKKEKEPIEYQ